jgi:hypothetical protein
MVAPDAMWDVRRPDPIRPNDPDGPVRTDGSDADLSQVVEDEDSVVKIRNPDGSMVVVFLEEEPDQEEDSAESESFGENLAEDIDELELSRIAEQLLEGIDTDERSREEWMSTRDEGIDLLGLKIERPRTGPGGGTTGTPLQGMSTAKDTTLLEAVVRGQANAIGEFLPATGPAKIEDFGDTVDEDPLAEDLEKNVNYYLTTIATEYYPDSKRMYAWLYFGGCGFKKGYHCPIRRRPVLESVDPQDLIVSNAATDLMNADRVTHQIEMRQSVFRRMVMEGVYRDVVFAPPTMPDKNRVAQKLEFIEGVRAQSHRQEDQPHLIYETLCELEIEDDKFVPDDFKKFRVPVPYKVTIEKDSRQILEIRRHWKEEDEDCRMRKSFVKYSFIDWLGFYGLGLLHLIGNLQLAITAMLRIAIDNGMFANFPGGLMAKKQGADQTTNQLNPGPGQFAMVDIGGLDDIAKSVMKLPYSDVTAGLLQLINMVREFAQRVAGTADIPVGEGKADIPVGTIMAMIEQSTKVESAVHKGMHVSQAEELEILVELLREDPGALFRDKRNKTRNKYSNSDWDVPLALKALNAWNLVPKSDPNTPSHIHRIMKTVALIQVVQQNPAAFDMNAVMEEVLSVMGYHNPTKFLKDPNTPPPPPSPDQITAQAKMQDSQTKQLEAMTKAKVAAGDVQNAGAELQDKAADRQAQQTIEDTRLARELVIHAHDRQVAQADAGLAAAKHAHQVQMDTHQAAVDQHNMGLAQAEHNLNLKKHAVEAAGAAHQAALDTMEATKPEPEPTGQ